MPNNNPIKYSDLVAPDNAITDLITQLQDLMKQYKETAGGIKAEAQQLVDSIKKVSGATEDGRGATKQAATDADRLAKAQRDLAFAQSETAREIAELKAAQSEANQINKLTVKLNNSAEGSYNRLSAQYSLNKIRINSMTDAERENAEQTEGLITKTRELYEEMKRLQEETGKHQLNVGNYPEVSGAIAGVSDKLTELIGLNGQFGQSILALGRGGTETKAIFTAIGDGVKALGTSLMGLLTNPVFIAIAGIAGAGVAFKWWYDYNAGLIEATRLTQQFTSKSGDALIAYRIQVQTIAETFNKDFREVLISANAVSKQFGITADEALRLIQDGFIAGADANEEFLDTLKEYPAYFKEAGITADQFIAIIAQTTKSGIFSDKGVDAIKEANLRLREMTTATAEALEGIGISSAKVQEELQSGAKTTFQIMQEVSAKLNELPDSSAAVGTAIADIFGGPGEDAGLQYLRTLKDISTNLDEVKTQAGILGELQEQQLQSQLELQAALAGLFDLTGGNFETLQTRVKVFVNGALTALIKGVIGLVNYIIAIYNHSLALRASLQGIFVVFKQGFDTITNTITFFVELIKGAGRILKGAFTLDWDEFKQGMIDYSKALPRLIKESLKDTKDNFKEGFDAINKEVEPITIPVVTADASSPDIKPQTAPVTTPQPKVTDRETEAEKAAKKAAEAAEKAYKKNLDATRKYEDAKLSLEKDEWKKRAQQTKYQYGRQIEDLKHQLVTDKELNESGRAAINATIESLEQQQTEALLRIEKERQLQELQLQKQTIALRLKAVKVGSEQERQLKLQQLEVDRQIALKQNELKPSEQRQSEKDINAQFDLDAINIAETYKNAQLEIFDQQQALAQSEFDLLKSSEQQKTEYRLKAEKERLNKILELNEIAGKKLTDVEFKTIQNQIAKIDQEISRNKKNVTDIYDAFGLQLDDETKAGIDSSVQYAMDALNTYMNEYVAAADRKVQLTDRDVDNAQKALEMEIEARNAGYAHNVAAAQRELDLAKKNQQKALKEQEKAQKAQQAIQTVMQIGDLVTASAMIWSQLGFPWALPAIGVMWGSFAASKIKAAQLAKSETYGDGTVEMLVGGSHQSGNDIDLGTKPDGTRRRAEGGEFFAVINKRNSRKYRNIIPDVINSFNDGTFAAKYMNAYAGTDDVTLNVSNQSLDLRNLSDDVRAIKEQNQRRIYIDANGNIIEVYKNLTRKIKS